MVGYAKVIDNCIGRTTADLNRINKFINEYNWKEIIVERHQTFLDIYIKNDYDIAKTAKECKYSINDILSIFLRIESQFEIYEKNIEGTGFKDLITDFDDLAAHPLAGKQIPETGIIRRDMRKQVKKKITQPIKETTNLQSGSAKKDAELMTILGYVKDIKNLKEILGDTIYSYVEDLLNGKTLPEIAEERHRKVRYILTTLLGVKNPRNRCEMGIRRLLEK